MTSTPVGPEGTERLPDWLSIQQAADMLQVHPDTLIRWAKNGRITIYKPGGPNSAINRIKREDVEKLATASRYEEGRLDGHES